MKEALQHTSHTRSILVRTRTNFGITTTDSFAPYTTHRSLDFQVHYPTLKIIPSSTYTHHTKHVSYTTEWMREDTASCSHHYNSSPKLPKEGFPRASLN